MTEFKSLQQMHYDLLVRLDQEPGEIEIQEIENFIEHVKASATDIPDPVDRDQLRAILRSWAAYIYDHTGEFPDTTLQTLDLEKSKQLIRTKTVDHKPSWNIILIIVLGIIILVYGASAIISWVTTDRNAIIRQTEEAISTAAQIQLESSQTAIAMSRTATPTNTLEPTPSTTPSPTATLQAQVITPSQITPPDAGIQILVENLDNGTTIPANILITGTYDGLIPGTSIHILLQPIKQCGTNNILVPESKLVEQPSGRWQIPVTFGQGDELLVEEQYNIRLYFAQNQEVRDALAKNQSKFSTCFDTGDLPTGFYPYSPLVVNINRSRYEPRLVFATRKLDSNYYDLATTRLDGSDFRLLTDTDEIDEHEPHVCQGNQKIVFVDKSPIRRAQNQIWIMDLNGDNKEVLAAGYDVTYERPLWSPDCKYIAYARFAPSEETMKIEIIEYDQRELGPITLGQGRYPTWMPEGHVLIFNHLITDRRNYPSFALMNLDQCQLLHEEKESDCYQDTSRFKHLGTPVQGLQPAVSPDGKRLAFTTVVLYQGDHPYKYIQGFDLDASNPVYNFTTSTGLYTDEYPTWGPDPASTTVFFQSLRRQNTNIWSVGVDSTNLTPIGPKDCININVTYQLLAIDLIGP